MSTVKLVDENTKDPRVRALFQDIKATKQIDRVPNIWRALATHPEHLELCWTRLKAIMKPGPSLLDRTLKPWRQPSQEAPFWRR